MTAPLVFDQRASLHGKPGLHALLVGVSDYPHLPAENQAPTPHSYGMSKLSSTALTAYKVFRWLEKRRNHLAAPLATVRLLLSPSPAELAAEGGMNGLTLPATLDNFLTAAAAWRADAAGHADGATFFYFAGHGVQRSKGDAVLLLEGFGDGSANPLRHAADIHGVFYGMAPAPSIPTIARTQFYFIDACRIFPTEFKRLEAIPIAPVFPVELAGVDDRRAPVFYAAVPGTRAYAVKGTQTLFSEALLKCLDGAAGDSEEDDHGQVRWFISLASLNRALELWFDNQNYGAEQEFIPGASKDVKIHWLDAAPSVDVQLELVPDAALPYARLDVQDAEGNLVQGIPMPLHPPRPFRAEWPAGIYSIRTTISHPDYQAGPVSIRPVLPPRLKWTRRLGS